ncbi:MAG: exodeoxyribonuclease VII large subunit [Saprospiraceae bacterium]
MVSYTLFELNEYIKRVVALNFQEPVWIECEISQVKESRGNFYLDFVQKKQDSDEVVAQSSGYIWYKSVLFLRKKLGDLFYALLKDGTAVKIKVNIEFHERYGLKLNIEDIDPSFTVGQLEMLRQKVIQKLKEEGKLDLNKELVFPSVVQRIAVISSETAAGYADFVQQLKNNQYGYDIKQTLFQAALQGSNTEREVVAALDHIFLRKDEFDVIVIIRGGGSKLDLAGFDNYAIASKISKAPLPVIAGIGHEIDLTVTDLVAYDYAKTPTAVAAYIIDHNVQFESTVFDLSSNILNNVQGILKHQMLYCNQLISSLMYLPGEMLGRQHLLVDHIMTRLLLLSQNKWVNQKELLAFAEKQMDLSDPKNILKKGYTMVQSGNKTLVSSKQILKDQPYSLIFADGKVNIKKIENGEK